MWAIHATRETITVDSHGVSWRSVRQVPMFYLHPNVQGIVNEAQAIAVAKDILSASDNETLHVYAHPIYAKALED